MQRRHEVRVAVFLVIAREGKILLQLRQNTGYMDGKWDTAASGHVDEGERLEDAMVRETMEEIGVKVEKKDFRLMGFEYDETCSYFRGFFGCERYEGEPRVMEPEKNGGLEWFELMDLPDLTPGAAEAVDMVRRGVFYDIK